MNQKKLKEAMEHINITEEMQADILRNVRKKQQGRQYPISFKIIPIAAAALLAIGIISIPVQAGIRYLIKERMENLPEEEISAISEMMAVQDYSKGDADGFSRNYTQEELARKAELFKAYQNGTFPEGELLRITDEAQKDPDMLCYNEANSLFYFPDRELTDEELLQIIDFNYKRDYALEQTQEVKEVRAEQEKEQRKLEIQVADQGCVDEAKAIATAKSWMNSLFSLSTDGMEQNCYLEDSRFEVPAYCITFSIQSNCYYYFWVNTLDGSLLQVSVSQAKWLDEEDTISKENAEEQARNAFGAAKNFLEEKLGIYEDYKEIHCFYYLIDGEEPGHLFWFWFFREDGSAYSLSLRGTDSALTNFALTDQENYRKTIDIAVQERNRTIVPIDLE